MANRLKKELEGTIGKGMLWTTESLFVVNRTVFLRRESINNKSFLSIYKKEKLLLICKGVRVWSIGGSNP